MAFWQINTFSKKSSEKKRRIWLLVALVLMLCTTAAFKFFSPSGRAATTFTNQVNISGNNFSTSLNEQVFYSSKFDTNKLFRPGLKEYIRSGFTQSRKKDIVFFGRADKNSSVWLFVQLVNPDTASKKLVLEISNNHSDRITAYTLSNNVLNPAGAVGKKIPLAKRAFPFFEFALPFNINPRDSIGILLKSERYFGVHGLALTVSDVNTFLPKAINTNFQVVFQAVAYITVMLVAFIIGFIFRRPLLLYLGLYLLSVSLVFFAHNQFFDSSLLAGVIGGGKAGTIEIFFIFLTNACFHPFGYQILKPYLSYGSTYTYYAGSLFGLNVLMALIMLLPNSSFNFFMPATVYIFWALLIINIVWVFTASGWLYLKRGVVWYIAICTLALWPLLLGIILNTGHVNTGADVILVNFDNSFFALLAVSILVTIQISGELIHKKTMDENMLQLQSSMELLRKAEIEKIGRNLHDQVGNSLASALGYLNLEKDYTDKAKEMIYDAISELRFTSHNLVKDNDDVLTDKVTLLVSRFNDFSKVNFLFADYSGGAINRLPAFSQQNIYSIIQELLTNIIKHANANIAYVQFFNSQETLQVSVEDDGTGFNSLEDKGIGLQNLKKRATLANFKVTIDSTGNGTSVIIDIEK
jgi:signal transduction histidine kinase